MKKPILLIILFASINFAQNNLSQYNSLRTPVSPGFIMLGVEPISVDRPNSPSDFAFTIINNVDNPSLLTNDFAVEASPYWLFTHPHLSWRDDIKRNFSESILRTLSLSIATAEIGDETFPVKGLAAGFRASLISGKMTENSIKNLEILQLRLASEASIFARLSERYRTGMDAAFLQKVEEFRDDPVKIEELRKTYEAALSQINEFIINDPEYQDSIQAVREEVQMFAVMREGFFLDFALGGMWAFEKGIVDSGKFNRLGFWLAPAYISSALNFSGIIRYFFQEDYNDAIDYGARLIYTHNKFAVSGEALGRSYLEDNAPDTQFRGALIIEYMVLPETWVSVTIGKDFNGGEENSLLAVAGINFNFSSTRFKLE